MKEEQPTGSAQERIEELEAELAEREEDLRAALLELHAIKHSLGWRALERYRRLVRWAAPAGSRRHRLYLLWIKGIEAVLRRPSALLRNPLSAARWAKRVLASSHVLPLDVQYQAWLQRHSLTPRRRQELAQVAAHLQYQPLISIITPVFNAPEAWLREAIESVRGQIYPRWELCLANDGSTAAHVPQVLGEYARAEPRIKVTHLPQNQGIAAATNEALKLATGEFVGFLDHDDVLQPHALLEVVQRLNQEPDLDLIYSDEDKIAADGRRVDPFFKPDWSPDLLLCGNYLTHFLVYRRSLLEKVGGPRSEMDGAQDWDLVLRATEMTSRIGHIPLPLYSWRMAPGSAASSARAKPYAYPAARRALKEALARRGWQGEVEETAIPRQYRVRYPLPKEALVSIIIPTRDKAGLLRRCLNSIARKTSYEPYQVVVVDSAPQEPLPPYLKRFSPRLLLLPYQGPFNFARAVNLGVSHSQGEYLLLLNDDTEVVNADWLQAMLEHAQRSEVAAVGARLLYPDGRVQHEGMVLGLRGWSAANVHFDYMRLGECIRNCSAVAGTCLMTRRAVFAELGGFDEAFALVHSDVDYCLRARQKGYLIVYTPYATLYHREGASRGNLHPAADEQLFRRRWGNPGERPDPYYNPNFDRQQPTVSLKL